MSDASRYRSPAGMWRNWTCRYWSVKCDLVFIHPSNHQHIFRIKTKPSRKQHSPQLRDGQRERMTAESSTLITAVDFDSLRPTNVDALRRLRLMAHKIDRKISPMIDRQMANVSSQITLRLVEEKFSYHQRSPSTKKKKPQHISTDRVIQLTLGISQLYTANLFLDSFFFFIFKEPVILTLRHKMSNQRNPREVFFSCHSNVVVRRSSFKFLVQIINKINSYFLRHAVVGGFCHFRDALSSELWFVVL